MKAVARKPHQDSADKKRHDTVHSPLKNAHSINNGYQTSIIQLKPICPCDGGCPRCAPIIQPKLIIGQPDDKYEQEADRVAEQVMSMPEPRLQRQAEEEEPEEEEEELIQTKQVSIHAPAVTPNLASHIQSLEGGGQPLPRSMRAFFEPRFGYDFSQVRVHTDSHARNTARAINAKAFTTGNDVVFGAGQYSPETSAGKRLLAHELMHVIQQRSATSLKNGVSKPSQKISRYVPTYMVQRHLSINNAVSEFKSRLSNPTLVKRGQFYWSYELKSAIKNKYQSILDASWSGTQKTALQGDLDSLLNLCYDPRRKGASINRLRGKILRFLSSSGNPSAPQIKKIIGTGYYRTRAKGTSLFRVLWNQYKKTLTLPNLTPHARFDKLQGLSMFEYIACWSAAQRVPGFFVAKGGYSVGTRSRRTKIRGIPLCRRVRRDNTNVGGYKKGDVVGYYANLGSTINKIEIALDDGHLIHARVLSGIYAGAKPTCKEEHSINIIGYDGNKFVFWDPDTNASKKFGGGFGFVYYDSTLKRFTTAQNDADLRVDSNGDHRSGLQHRYQVLTVKTV